MPAKKLLTAKKLQTAVITALEDAKAQDIVSLDVRKMTDVADYMIVASGTSTRHVASMADKVADKLRTLGRKPLGIEGQDIGEWVLIDYGDVVVHLMRPQTRDFYNLEKLWSVPPLANASPAADMEQRIRQRRARK